MSTRPDKPKEYFTKLLSASEADIDYSEVPATDRGDWADAEALLPVTPEEFLAIRDFLRIRRQRDTAVADRSAE